jgi:hypothetical protein
MSSSVSGGSINGGNINSVVRRGGTGKGTRDSILLPVQEARLLQLSSLSQQDGSMCLAILHLTQCRKCKKWGVKMNVQRQSEAPSCFGSESG